MDKKGQSISLNVIIIAAIALIVLVVLVLIFTGRINVFEEGVSKESQAELIKMKIQYGDCRPTLTTESNFIKALDGTESVDQEDAIKSDFDTEISRCDAFNDKINCESADCKWS